MSIRAARFALPAALLAGLLPVAAPSMAQRQPQSLQSAERIDWWARIETIESLLVKQKWKGALRQTVRTIEYAQNEAWSSPDLPRVIAELALRQAIAEMNLGRPNEAIWHWYTALNLVPDIATRDLGGYALGGKLSDVALRDATEMPREFDRLSDLEQLQMDPAVFPDATPPDLITQAAATLQRAPDILIELIVDASGALRQPVLLTEDAHPVLVYAAFEWLLELSPARPARYDGRPVDSLETVNVSFKLERTGGQVFLPPIETTRPDGPPNNNPDR